MAKTMIHRVWQISSTNKIATDNVDKVVNMLRANGYDRSFCERMVRETVCGIHCGRQRNEAQARVTLSIPYSTGASRFRKRVLAMEKNSQDIKINVIFQTTKVASYFSNKSKTPYELCSNVVYEFQCHGCAARYIGESCRHLRTRVLEHQQNSRKSHINEHIFGCSARTERLRISEFKIVGRNFAATDERMACEALLIDSTKPALNVQVDFKKTLFLFI